MMRTCSVELPYVIAAAARRLLSEGGPRAVTQRAVAANAGVSASSVLNKFGSIDELLDYVALRGLLDLIDAVFEGELGEVRLDHLEPVERLPQALERYRGWALANRELYRLMFAAPVRGITPSSYNRSAATQLVALFVAAAGSEEVGMARFAEVHGAIHLALSGLAFSWVDGAT